MVDTRTKEQRHKIMAAVRSKDTQPELLVRKYLWAHGIRYRLHLKSLPGTPDIVIPKLKIVIFVHGCFWHGHESCSLGRLPKSHLDYWKEKIEKNKNRDRKSLKQLKEMGWRVIIIWNCQLRTNKNARISLPKILKEITILSEGVAKECNYGTPRK
ncbi:MAG: very short patch repair endonuclease [Methanoregulaceae archaeon]|jgi:DNA mismatch endonuclease (patch repair protein)